MFTFAFTHNPLLRPPPAGTVDLISWWQVRYRGRLNFFGWWKGGRRRFLTEGGVVTGWAATLTRAPWVPSAGAKVWRCSGVGVGIRSSKDKHQWEYERLDANRSGSHAIPSQKKPQERAWPCARVFLLLAAFAELRAKLSQKLLALKYIPSHFNPSALPNLQHYAPDRITCKFTFRTHVDKSCGVFKYTFTFIWSLFGTIVYFQEDLK